MPITSGNTKSQSLNLTFDAVRQTSDDKLSFYAQVLRSSSDIDGVSRTTANQWAAGTRYTHDISANTFGFGGLDFNHDEIKRLSLRSVVSGGIGYHMVKTTENQWDILGGIAYREDRHYYPGVIIKDKLEMTIQVVELLLGEESNHKLTESTSFKQRLTINPNMSSNKGYRATFDAGLLVALNKAISLNITLQDRYDSLSQAPTKKNDLLFFTGINVKFGG